MAKDWSCAIPAGSILWGVARERGQPRNSWAVGAARPLAGGFPPRQEITIAGAFFKGKVGNNIAYNINNLARLASRKPDFRPEAIFRSGSAKCLIY